MLPTVPRLSTLPAISQPFKRSQEGLFHGKMKQYGNNVPHSKHKTRRTWLPNIRSKRLPLEATGDKLKLKVSTRALRSIKKAGSLDNYVMNTRSNLLGMEGMRLRILVRSRLEEEARLKEKADKAQRAKEKEERRKVFLLSASEVKSGVKKSSTAQRAMTIQAKRNAFLKRVKKSSASKAPMQQLPRKSSGRQRRSVTPPS